MGCGIMFPRDYEGEVYVKQSANKYTFILTSVVGCNHLHENRNLNRNIIFKNVTFGKFLLFLLYTSIIGKILIIIMLIVIHC